MRSRPVPIRLGDVVRIREAFFVTRVGYPKCLDDYAEEVEALVGDELTALVVKVGKRTGSFDFTKVDTNVRNDMKRRLAYLMAKRNGFGGSERTLHEKAIPEHEGLTARVVSVRSVQTGTYFGPSGGYSSWSGEYDYEPGGLYNMKTVRLVTISPPGNGIYGPKDKLEIATMRVELVERAGYLSGQSREEGE